MKDYHPILRKIMTIGAIILLLTGLVLLYWYKDKNYTQFTAQQERTQHILIDKVDGTNIYLVIYNKDTLGVVSVK